MWRLLNAQNFKSPKLSDNDINIIDDKDDIGFDYDAGAGADADVDAESDCRGWSDAESNADSDFNAGDKELCSKHYVRT